jgi:hypothetical protein
MKDKSEDYSLSLVLHKDFHEKNQHLSLTEPIFKKFYMQLSLNDQMKGQKLQSTSIKIKV